MKVSSGSAGKIMVRSSRPSLQIDLNEFKLFLYPRGQSQLTLHFNSPSRRFYLAVIALVVNEMKRLGKIRSIPLQEHTELLGLLNETIGGAAGSSDKENLSHRIYRKWKDALPNLEEAPLFKVLGRKKEERDGETGKTYSFSDAEKDGWANLFEYVGSEENVRLKFAIDKIGVSLEESSIAFGDSLNAEAWEQFVSSLKNGKQEEQEKSTPGEEAGAPKAPWVLSSSHPNWKASRFFPYRWALPVALLAVVIVAAWKTFLSPPAIERASVERMKYLLPDQPSIAVLPFANMSGDPKQEFLCDGMTENVITALSKVPTLFVIARNSTFTYKGKPVKTRQVSEELGVRYVLEGSIQRSADRIRITTQLIDALSGKHLWAERYDRDLKDLFLLQDEITLKVLAGVQVKLIWGGDVSRTVKFAEKYYQGKKGLECYLKFMEADSHRFRWTIEDNNIARRIVEEAMALCPENPMAYLNLAWVYHTDSLIGNSNSSREALEKAKKLAQKALAMDGSITGAHVLLCHCYYRTGEFEKAIAEGERAVSLNPNGISVLNSYACSLSAAGRAEEAVPVFQKAIRLSPFGPSFLYRDFGWALRNMGLYEEAVSAYKKAIQIAPDDMLAHLYLTGAYIMMDREPEARAEAAEVLRINPKFSVDHYAKIIPYKDQSEKNRVINALWKAGLK